MSHMFEVLTSENSATVTLTNNLTGASQSVVTGQGVKAIAYAVFCFAKQQGVSARHIGYSVVSPSSSVSRETRLPDWAPAIGSTVKLHTNGKRKAPVPHTIESYSVSPNDGTWIFKAVDFAGWSHIDTVDALR